MMDNTRGKFVVDSIALSVQDNTQFTTYQVSLWLSLIEEYGMKAIRIHQFGAPEVMQYEEVPTPDPGSWPGARTL